MLDDELLQQIQKNSSNVELLNVSELRSIKYRNKQYDQFHMDAFIRISNVVADGYQIVQTVRFKRPPGRRQKGCKTVTKDGESFDAFVDGGRCSPGVVDGSRGDDGRIYKQKEAVTGKPYYNRKLPKDILEALKNAGIAIDTNGDGDKGLITLNDAQYAALNYEAIWFRSYIVAINYNKTAKDRVLGLIMWGFNKKGTEPHKDNSELKILPNTKFLLTDEAIILNDYPKYNFFGKSAPSKNRK